MSNSHCNSMKKQIFEFKFILLSENRQIFWINSGHSISATIRASWCIMTPTGRIKWDKFTTYRTYCHTSSIDKQWQWMGFLLSLSILIWCPEPPVWNCVCHILQEFLGFPSVSTSWVPHLITTLGHGTFSVDPRSRRWHGFMLNILWAQLRFHPM